MGDTYAAAAYLYCCQTPYTIWAPDNLAALVYTFLYIYILICDGSVLFHSSLGLTRPVTGRAFTHVRRLKNSLRAVHCHCTAATTAHTCVAYYECTNGTDEGVGRLTLSFGGRGHFYAVNNNISSKRDYRALRLGVRFGRDRTLILLQDGCSSHSFDGSTHLSHIISGRGHHYIYNILLLYRWYTYTSNDCNDSLISIGHYY